MTTDWEVLARASYDRVAQPYTDLTRDALTRNPYMASLYRTLAALARVGAAQPAVVDVGCGPGMWTHYLAESGVHAVGIDISEAMIRIAREGHSAATFAVGSVLELPLSTGCADAVACMYLLHHVPDDNVEAVLDEIVRLLKPNGALLLGGHIGTSRRTKTSGYGGHLMHVEVIRRPADFWVEALDARGFSIEAHTTYDPGSESETHALFARKADRA